MSIFAEKKTNKEKEIYEDILGKEILSRKRERKGDFRNAVMDLHLKLQYNYSFSLHNSISLPANMIYSQHIKMFYGSPQFHKE